MKLLLDTTYFLPAIGISIKDIPQDAVIRLIESGYEVYISEITLFELSAKGAKYVVSRMLSPERVLRGLRAIIYDNRVDRVPIYDTTILSTAFKIRSLLNDFIDCLILSSAINKANALVTEDDDILMLLHKKEFNSIIERLNSKFEIMTIKDLIH
ncbi:MAG: PIN domain-containing protein [Thermoprotei archaeon]|nr:PIN domain-containing protein [Thermoprotei archaeon]